MKIGVAIVFILYMLVNVAYVSCNPIFQTQIASH
jgi:hypothetical protein